MRAALPRRDGHGGSDLTDQGIRHDNADRADNDIGVAAADQNRVFPVAPKSAPAFIIAEVAMLFVPMA